jgi:hypothetical protein
MDIETIFNYEAYPKRLPAKDEPAPIPILEFDVIGLLTRLFVQTKIRKWRILDDEELELINHSSRETNLRDAHPDRFLTMDRSNDDVDPPWDWKTRADKAIEYLTDSFPTVKETLLKFNGKIIAAGGAVFQRLNGIIPPKEGDIDLFFIDPAVESDTISDSDKSTAATNLLLEAVAYMSNLWMHGPDSANRQSPHVIVARSECVTTVYLYEGVYYNKIQFIHRVYPNAASVLGGFDLTPCMVAYDGYRILALEIGAWSALGRINIVDISRRSTSFEHRLHKYGRYCKTIFPGLTPHVEPVHCSKWLPDFREVPAFIDREFVKLGYHITVDTDGYGVLTKIEKDGGVNKRKAIEELRRLAAVYGYSIRNIQLETNLDYSEDPSNEAIEQVKEKLFKVGYLLEFEQYLRNLDDNIHNMYERDDLHGVNNVHKILHLPRLDINVGKTRMDRRWNVRVAKHPDIKYGTTNCDYEECDGLIYVEQGHDKIKVSDYEESSVDPHFIAVNNLSMLITGNVKGVTSLVILRQSDKEFDLEYFNNRWVACSKFKMEALQDQIVTAKNLKDIQTALIKSFQTVSLGNLDLLATGCMQLADAVGDHIPNDYDNTRRLRESARNFMFPNRRHYGLNICPKPSPQEWNDLYAKLGQNIHAVVQNLREVKWIIRNPGRQWTSSINPIVADPRDWYGAYYRSCRIGNLQTETTLRLFRLRQGNYFHAMPRDVFGYLMGFVVWVDSYCLKVHSTNP